MAEPLVVLDHFVPVFQTKRRYVNMRGGRGSGKSHHAALKCLKWLLSDEFERILCVRKHKDHIERSQHKIFSDFRIQYDLTELIGISKNPMRIWSKIPGSVNEIIFAGCDDPEKLKSTTGITKVWIEEPTELDPEDLKTISTGLRGPQIVNYPQILLSYNPISETHWLKSRFWDNPPKNSFNHLSTYLNNPTLTQADIDEIESYKDSDPDYYKVIALNQWGVIRTGQEFFEQFKRNIHVSDSLAIDKTKPVILSFDFNRLPYSTCLCIQLSYDDDGKRIITVFDEICLRPPNNTIEDISSELFDRHPWVKSIFFTGDPSGRSKGQRKSKDEADSYEEMIDITFSQYTHNHSNIFLSSAPPLAKRKSAMNKILNGQLAKLKINSRCINLVNDFESLQIDRTGGYIKKKVTDKRSGATYEDGGHCMDALIYYLAYEFTDHFF